jgi:hypothetical protein
LRKIPRVGCAGILRAKMGCRCNERQEALDRAGTALARGDVRALGREAGFVARTTVEDLRAGALQREALIRLARLRFGKGR